MLRYVLLSMTLIAHLSDLHILEAEHKQASLTRRGRLRLLSMGRAVDGAGRRARLLSALKCAARADHIIISGDLTEDGNPAQFETLAETLHESRVSPTRVTLVPGNHDAYTSQTAFLTALEGPLRAFAETSALGRPIHLPGVTVLPISTAVHQNVLLARGYLHEDQAHALEKVAKSSRSPVAVVQHHPPTFGWFHPVDGLKNLSVVQNVLRAHGHVHVFCGHTHIPFSRFVHSTDDTPRILCAPAVVDHAQPVRMYRAMCGRLVEEDEQIYNTLSVAV
jgi:3',5'-cyclic AMP phosphodiesterase CpdA